MTNNNNSPAIKLSAQTMAHGIAIRSRMTGERGLFDTCVKVATWRDELKASGISVRAAVDIVTARAELLGARDHTGFSNATVARYANIADMFTRANVPGDDTLAADMRNYLRDGSIATLEQWADKCVADNLTAIEPAATLWAEIRETAETQARDAKRAKSPATATGSANATDATGDTDTPTPVPAIDMSAPEFVEFVSEWIAANVPALSDDERAEIAALEFMFAAIAE